MEEKEQQGVLKEEDVLEGFEGADELIETLESIKQKVDLLEKVKEAVEQGRDLHDNPDKETLTMEKALSTLEVLGLVVRQELVIANVENPEVRTKSVEILKLVQEAHNKILSHVLG